MGIQLRKSKCVIHKDFYERGRYVAHNRDVGYSPTHSELINKTVLRQPPKLCCKSDQRTSVASSGGSSYLLYDNDD